MPNEQRITINLGQMKNVMPVYEGMQNNTASTMTPMVIQLLPRGAPDVFQRATVPGHPAMQMGFPFHVVHSPIVLFIPANERLFPTVVLKVAGYCESCGKTHDPVALETLENYLAATAYEGETARDRGIRSRAFTDGFEAAHFTFKSAGQAQPQSYVGTAVQH